MTYSEALRYIERLHGRGICPGLSRMEAALEAVGHPERQLRVVHVAGTNGKGSTAAMIAAVATAADYKVGLYTSPAVTTTADTITINGHPIPEEVFASLTTELAAAAGDLTEFEFVTLLTLVWFARERVELAVIECGLGGAEDATNVFPAPLCAVFTPISLDHTRLLGETVEEIAAQKAGIIKAPCAVVSSPEQSPEALGVLFGYAAAQGLTVRVPASGRQVPPLGMSGAHQQKNAQTALETLSALSEKGFTFTEDQIANGLAGLTLPCRQERIREHILLDGGHNPQAAEALAAQINTLWGHTGVVLLVGMLADKDVAAYARILQPHCVKVFCCTPDHPDRALAAAALAAHYDDAAIIPDISQAVVAARQYADTHNLPLIIGGSFYLAATARRVLCEN